ncbi:hypothetical protein SBV1_2210003 [Verrucomicrobia bacterium]|nr:hypothetical protein SBV1_2210003 [Verrucomicrobiota bacterium]
MVENGWWMTAAGTKAQRLSGLKDFFAEAQGWIGPQSPWPIQPWALGRNPVGIRRGEG